MAGEKGKNAEREVAAMLKAWWSPLEPDCEFVRTPMSGGWSHGVARETFAAAGDIMTTAKTFPFCVEVKRRESWTLLGLQGRFPFSPVWDWWMQCQRDAASIHKIPALVFRKNRQPWRLWLPVRSTYWMPHTVSPEYQWSKDQLCAVQYGPLPPVQYLLHDILNVPPAYFQTLKPG